MYADGMFVEMDYSRETLALIPNALAWITNEYKHNGLRADGERVLGKLIATGSQGENYCGGPKRVIDLATAVCKQPGCARVWCADLGEHRYAQGNKCVDTMRRVCDEFAKSTWL